MDGIAARIHRARGLAGLTQSELARRMCVGEMQISRWERGVQPRPEHLVALARALNVTAEWLVTGDAPATGTEG